jgi:hypothetical protein
VMSKVKGFKIEKGNIVAHKTHNVRLKIAHQPNKKRKNQCKSAS